MRVPLAPFPDSIRVGTSKYGRLLQKFHCLHPTDAVRWWRWWRERGVVPRGRSLLGVGDFDLTSQESRFLAGCSIRLAKGGSLGSWSQRLPVAPKALFSHP